jgi:GAF domain-containing protein
MGSRMQIVNPDTRLSKAHLYRDLKGQLAALFAGERNGLANAANMSALLYQALPDLNWVGFYFLQGGELVLGLNAAVDLLLQNSELSRLVD